MREKNVNFSRTHLLDLGVSLKGHQKAEIIPVVEGHSMWGNYLSHVARKRSSLLTDSENDVTIKGMIKYKLTIRLLKKKQDKIYLRLSHRKARNIACEPLVCIPRNWKNSPS